MELADWRWIVGSLLVVGAAACSADDDRMLKCGAGTVEQNGECVVPVECGEGTVLEDGECVPADDCEADGTCPPADTGPVADTDPPGGDTVADVGVDTTTADTADSTSDARDGGNADDSFGPVVSGHNHVCAVTADRRVLCWGSNRHGQLGNGSTGSVVPEPVEVDGLSSVDSLAAGASHTCALLEDGEIRCWGKNDFGQLGDGAAVGQHSGTPVAVDGLSSVVSLTAGLGFTCALEASGEVSCWGTNASGELGNGSSSEEPTPTPVAVEGLSSVSVLDSGAAHTCARLESGELRCWGNNRYGQLGNGSSSESPNPSPVAVPGLSSVAEFALGAGHTCARLEDGTVQCWGLNRNGQIGNGSSSEEPVSTPTAVQGLDSVSSVAAGVFHTCAILDNGDTRCWGGNDWRQLGNPDQEADVVETPVSVRNLPTPDRLVAGQRHTCAVLAAGSGSRVRCWGGNRRGQLGRGGLKDSSPNPVQIQSLSAIAGLEGGGEHTCAWLEDGTARCWGDNEHEQLGSSSPDDTEPQPVEVQGFSVVSSMAAGGDHSCALLDTGSVRCWGSNDSGQLGNGNESETPQNPPVEVNDISTAAGIAAGRDHTCARLQNGKVECWGDNGYGELGNPGNAYAEFETAPLEVQNIDRARQIAAGHAFTCALLEDGSIRCWGRNRDGQLGDGTTDDADPSAEPDATPVAVDGIDSARAIALGARHGCALLEDDSVKCWGANSSGQLGDGTVTESVTTPTGVRGLSSVRAIAAGQAHSCAVLDDDTVECWGSNREGRLGTGAVGIGGDRSVTTPVPVASLSGEPTLISAGDGHTCVVLDDGTGRCWGDRRSGQLGDGRSYPEQDPSPAGVTGL